MARPGAAAASHALIVATPPSSAVAFVDAAHGWVGGGGGLLGTVDGRTFRVEASGSIIGISAFDRARAWAITGDGFVLRTFDGRNWSRLGAPHLIRLQFVDARVGFGLTRDGELVRSGDAGVSWAQARAPGPMDSECFVSRTVGWTAHGGSVWGTRNAGRTWTRARLRTGRQERPELGCGGADAWVVFHEGAAAGTEGYRVYRSLGGGPWRAVLASPFQRRLPSISSYAGPFAVLGHAAAILTGSCAPCDGAGTLTVTRTTNGGATFSRSVPLRGYSPEAVSFLDTRRGWLVTGRHNASASAVNGGILWSTRDGGRHWRTVLQSPALRS